VGVSVNVTVPDLSNAVTWRCINVRTDGSVALDPNQLPNIPGLNQAQKLFTDTEDFLIGKVNGVNQLITRLGAVARPLEAIGKWLNDVESLRSKLASIQPFPGLLLCAGAMYVLCVLLGLIQGIHMLVGPNT
jgi:hypothetical protein